MASPTPNSNTNVELTGDDIVVEYVERLVKAV